MTNKNVEEVNHPERYCGTCSIECIEAMELVVGWEGVVNFCICNALKYVWRYQNKNGIEDLHKANWYIDYVLVKKKDTRTTPPELITILHRLREIVIDAGDKCAM